MLANDHRTNYRPDAVAEFLNSSDRRSGQVSRTRLAHIRLVSPGWYMPLSLRHQGCFRPLRLSWGLGTRDAHRQARPVAALTAPIAAAYRHRVVR